MSTPEVDVRAADPFGGEAARLISRLSAELAALYPADTTAGAGAFRPDDVAGPGSAFLIAWAGGRPVGCGALRPMEPGVTEIKRMYVELDVRGRGIARRLLAELERRAAESGYVAVRLETGVRQVPAMRLYESAGYERIANYGIYAGNPLSACYEKPLPPV
jgi:GNAT superfamily N-acetyltransferase